MNASQLGRLLERRITGRFAPYKDRIEIIEETQLTQAYGACCFGIDHFIRFGTKQIHVQEKWEATAPKLRDLRHFVVASNALQGKLPLLEQPLRIFLSKRRINAPESLFVLEASKTENLSEFDNIEVAAEELYKYCCRHFGLEPLPLSAADLVALENVMLENIVAPRHPLQDSIIAELQILSENFSQMLEQLYSRVDPNTLAPLNDYASNSNLGAVIAFFKTKRDTPTGYDVWLSLLKEIRPIQVKMEQVNQETGNRIYPKSRIGAPALYPTEEEIAAMKLRMTGRGQRHNRRALVTVIKEETAQVETAEDTT
jgi:hypothetical protein